MLKELERLLRKETRQIPKPYGIFLSGGLDSGLLAALSKPQFAITCVFDDYSELKYTEKIAKHLKIPLEIIKPQKQQFEGFLYNAVKIIGKPINSVSIVPWYCLMGSAQGKTMIDGEGGDELFGGYSRYLIMKHIFELYDVPELENYKPTLDYLFGDIHSKLVEAEMPKTTNMLEIMNNEFKYTLPDIILMEHKLAEYFNVKFYQPYMSKSIQRFACNLPLNAKIRGFQTKVILRQLAEKYLPHSVVYRKTKQGLVSPALDWLGFNKSWKFDKKEYLNYQKRILK